ncbi:MAG: ankyrin repeat domain-containing protein [Alphaproteobacteria bacterium]|nr:ankyrin repeat domain-containing protein [Alphaproteobacteria bacterium]
MPAFWTREGRLKSKLAAYNKKPTSESLAAVRELLETGPPAPVKELQRAVARRQAHLVRVLVETGTDPLERTAYAGGKNSLELAFSWQGGDVFDVLFQAAVKEDERPAAVSAFFFKAIEDGNVSMVLRLLDRYGADVNAKSLETGGETALMAAVRGGNQQLVQQLLDCGANGNIVNKRNETAADIAAKKKNRKRILRLLEKRGYKSSIPVPDPKKKKDESWILLDKTTVAQVQDFKKIDTRIYTVFNAKARQQYILSEDMKTCKKTPSAPVSFDSVPLETLQAAFKAYGALGGDANGWTELAAKKSVLKPMTGVPRG